MNHQGNIAESDLRSECLIRTVGFIIENMMNTGLLKREDDVSYAENLLLRAFSEYEAFNAKECITPSGGIDKVAMAEQLVCIRTAIMDPDFYYGGNWREHFLSQRFMHDEEWVRDQEDLNYGDDK